MKTLLSVVGRTAGIAGVALCGVAGLQRLSGHNYLMGYEAMTLFTAGIGLMVMACLAKLETL